MVPAIHLFHGMGRCPGACRTGVRSRPRDLLPSTLCISELTWQHLALTAPLLPTPRSGMELAEGLYSQLEEELHDLVSQSNSCLERLEFLRKVRELETEFGKVSWVSLGCCKLKLPSVVFHG